MRPVYTSSQRGAGWRALAGAIALSLGVFLVLPLSQMLSDVAKRDLMVQEVHVAAPPPPPPPPMEEPEPEEEEEPTPELSEETQQLSLSELDLDLDLGTGPGFGSAFSAVDEAGKTLSEISIFDLGDLDNRPERLVTINPSYPAELRRSGAGGEVVVLFVVNEEGRVEDPRVESSTHPAFEQAVLAALKRWRFRPGNKDGDPVKSYVRQTFPFRVTR